ncbi:hypothetical protein QBC35DRAFT_547597 [Podospora australis]|uniref:Uncharacterized protein n=1 Tax=Podospora australis TaxID=1536484 RepID=A0AAN6WXC3_9PEZI|nr:hypothetical protein QBC35DRAFT_547597 [Podospora australis]
MTSELPVIQRFFSIFNHSGFAHSQQFGAFQPLNGFLPMRTTCTLHRLLQTFHSLFSPAAEKTCTDVYVAQWDSYFTSLEHQVSPENSLSFTAQSSSSSVNLFVRPRNSTESAAQRCTSHSVQAFVGDSMEEGWKKRDDHNVSRRAEELQQHQPKHPAETRIRQFRGTRPAAFLFMNLRKEEGCDKEEKTEWSLDCFFHQKGGLLESTVTVTGPHRLLRSPRCVVIVTPGSGGAPCVPGPLVWHLAMAKLSCLIPYLNTLHFSYA